ncbi:MAG: two-component sensor histidine kinase [Hyphomicrobiaceae bacterium]|nr:MAG: two-component sensor histidine kinase [Hyphomicrobiaceae bacterium]
MSSLRVRIAVALVVAIVSVVTVITGLVLALLSPPGPEHTIQPVARQLELLINAAEAHPESFNLASAPAVGAADQSTTEWLRDVILARGNGRKPEVIVVRAPGNGPMQASVRIGSRGWLVAPIPDLPPRKGPLHVLFGWLGLITIGATTIAVYVAHRMVLTLALLQNAVEKIGPDGTLPSLPEVGPAEVRATARALNTLSARLTSAMDSRMRVVAAAGHDMRTPITRMRLRTEFIEDDAERSHWLRDIDELNRIADSAIALVRASASTFEVENLRLDELVAAIASDLRDQKLDVHVVSTVPVSVRVDRLVLSRALRNLLINAATHGLSAEARVEHASPATARIVIQDRGPGIPDEKIGQVFEPFFRVDRARRQDIPGAGLGLTIAREIIQLAGGTITIRNGTGGGLVQEVDLPAV